MTSPFKKDYDKKEDMLRHNYLNVLPNLLLKNLVFEHAQHEPYLSEKYILNLPF